MKRPWIVLTLACCGCLAGCGGAEPEAAFAEPPAAVPLVMDTGVPVCSVEYAGRPLPDEVRESSGLAQSRRDPALFWTHNDSGNTPELFALDSTGHVVQRVSVPGAAIVDWEDIEAGPCAEGSCLYVADTGDNDGDRERVTVYRIPEPGSGATESAPAVALHGRFPEGARDVESLFILPSGEVFLVTKGRHGPIALYRYPAPLRPGETATLERVREIFPQPTDEDDRVTAATSSPDGRWVAIRSYRTLYLYPAAELVSGRPTEPRVVDLRPLGHVQGESVAIAADGRVWMSSEAEKKDTRPVWARLACSLPAA